MDSVTRRQSIAVKVGSVWMGGGAPIVVQSMTNTDTEEGAATVQQIQDLVRAGSELVRITVNTEKAAQQVPFIRDKLYELGCPVPLVGDFHYNGHRLLEQYPACAQALDKYRINPGNVGYGEKRDKQFIRLVEIALQYGKAIRIGVNWGSLDQDLSAREMDKNAKATRPRPVNEVLRETLILSALHSAQLAEKVGLTADRIILSCKVSRPPDLIAVHRQLAARCQYALHLGLTEAGIGSKGIVATTAALAILLQEGIGDTLRASQAAIGLKKCWFASRFYKHSTYVVFDLLFQHARVVDGPPAPIFNNSLVKLKPISKSGCRYGNKLITVLKILRLRSWAVWSMVPGKASMRISGLVCLEPVRIQRLRCL